MVCGPCTVWTVPENQFLVTNIKRPHPGMIVNMQWMREPHKNILRVSKEKLLFHEVYDPYAKDGRKEGIKHAIRGKRK